MIYFFFHFSDVGAVVAKSFGHLVVIHHANVFVDTKTNIRYRQKTWEYSRKFLFTMLINQKKLLHILRIATYNYISLNISSIKDRKIERHNDWFVDC